MLWVLPIACVWTSRPHLNQANLIAEGNLGESSSYRQVLASSAEGNSVNPFPSVIGGRFDGAGTFRFPNLTVSPGKLVIAESNCAFIFRDCPTWDSVSYDLNQFKATFASTAGPASLSGNVNDERITVENGGAEFTVTSTDAPYLTWPEGSVATQVPTPNLHWVLLSWPKQSSPVLLSLSGSEVSSFKVSGSPGAWKITSSAPLKFARFSCPFGEAQFATTDAGTLGNMADRFKRLQAFALRSPAILKRWVVQKGQRDWRSEWDFDGTAVVPPQLLQSRSAGFPLLLETELVALPTDKQAPAHLYTKGPRLVVDFPQFYSIPGMGWLSTGGEISPPLNKPAVSNSSPENFQNGSASEPNLRADIAFSYSPYSQHYYPSRSKVDSFAQVLHTWMAEFARTQDPNVGNADELAAQLLTRFDSLSWRLDPQETPTDPGTRESEDEIQELGSELILIQGMAQKNPEYLVIGAMMQSALAADQFPRRLPIWATKGRFGFFGTDGKEPVQISSSGAFNQGVILSYPVKGRSAIASRIIVPTGYHVVATTGTQSLTETRLTEYTEEIVISPVSGSQTSSVQILPQPVPEPKAPGRN